MTRTRLPHHALVATAEPQLCAATPLDAPGMGTFEVTGDKITAWRAYFSGMEA
jgi:hypothetical protein